MEITYPYNAAWRIYKHEHEVLGTVLASAEIERFSDKGFVFLVQIDPL